MRILLQKGEQQRLMEKILSKISVAKAAKFCNLSERTIRDWRREKFLMNKNAMMKLPEDLTALLKHVVELQKHMETNKQDMSAKRGLTITESKIGRIVKYYKRSKRLPETWKYDRNNVQLLLK